MRFVVLGYGGFVVLFLLFSGLDGCHRGCAREVAAKEQIRCFRVALDAYKQDTAEFPSTTQGLAALRVAPAGVKGWQGPYMPQDIPQDPWGEPYSYSLPDGPGAKPVITAARNGICPNPGKTMVPP